MSMSHKSCCCEVTERQVLPSQASSPLASRATGMSLRVCTLLALLVVTVQHTQARPSQRGVPMIYASEQDAADSAFDPDQRGSREVANLMYQMLQRAAQQQQQQQLQQQQLEQLHQPQDHQEEGEQDSNPMPPEDFPVASEPLGAADKRGSYMSLCHFKICNMGRKRNLRKSQWSRF